MESIAGKMVIYHKTHICVIYCIFRPKLANTKKLAKIIKCINVQNIHPWSSTSTVVGKLIRHYTHHPEVGSPSTAWSTSAVAGKPSQPFIVEKMAQNHKVHKSSKYTPLIEHINNSWEVRKSLSTSAVAGKPRVISEEIPTTALSTSTSSCQAHTS